MAVPEKTGEIPPRGADVDADPSFEAIHRAVAPWLVRFFLRQPGNADDAQHLFQEAKLRFIRIAPSTSIATQQNYLRRIANNLLRNRFKSGAERFGQRSVPLVEGRDQEPHFEQHRVIASREERAEWRQILSRLKPRTLEILLLSRIDGGTYGDIAAQLCMTVWNVKSHMINAIAHAERHRRLR